MKRCERGYVEVGGVAILIYVVLFVLAAIGYVMNIVKLCHCDFKAPYKAEIIYGLGTVTGIGAVTGYLNLGK